MKVKRNTLLVTNDEERVILQYNTRIDTLYSVITSALENKEIPSEKIQPIIQSYIDLMAERAMFIYELISCHESVKICKVIRYELTNLTDNILDYCVQYVDEENI